MEAGRRQGQGHWDRRLPASCRMQAGRPGRPCLMQGRSISGTGAQKYFTRPAVRRWRTWTQAMPCC